MKTKVLICVISFIFLFSCKIYAAENIVDINNEVFEKIDIVENLENETINLEATIEYNGTMNLEEPANNKEFVRPNNTQIKIGGWAVSNDPNAFLRIILDGNIIQENVERLQRPDVDSIISPAYGGISNTPNAGFVANIDISNLSEGAHLLIIEQIVSSSKVISAVQSQIIVKNTQYNGTMNLENPTYNKSFIRPDNDKIEVGGWAVSSDSNAILRIFVDGKIVKENAKRIARQDVDSIISPSYGGTQNTPKAGFLENIDISQLQAGNHQIKVEELSRYGQIICSYETNIEVKNKQYTGTMNLENPTYNKSFIRPDDDKIEVGGWAVSNDLNAILRIFVDGKIVKENAKRIARPDVDSIISPSYGGAQNTPKAGFLESIDISNLEKGNHQIKVEELSRYGQIICSYETNIEVKNKQYQGLMNLETPIYNQNFTRPDDAKIEISGWAVSNDENSSLRILINENIVQEGINRIQRPDVDEMISPSYGGKEKSLNAGFKNIVDIQNFGQGRHKIRVEEISRYNEVICAYETEIEIVNKKYLGEMFLDTPKSEESFVQGQNVTIMGWAVSQDENATVEVYLNGQWKATAGRFYRQDIENYMAKYDSKTISAGFGTLINTSNLAPGKYTLTVYEKSRYGDVIGGIEVKIWVKSNQVIENPENYDDYEYEKQDKIELPKETVTINTNGTKGIDVSQHQGVIDWKKVADSGIKYAMIRIGYRGYGTGGFAEDTKFKYNFTNAVQNGLKVGVYFYSTSVNLSEATKDAEYVLSLLRKYGFQNAVSMPIAIDLELIPGVNTRDKDVSKMLRTNIANVFCRAMENNGYDSMIYACKSFLNDNMVPDKIQYDVWVAQYNSKCTYKGPYTMWQYTSTGKVSGINGNVDCNLCYKNY